MSTWPQLRENLKILPAGTTKEHWAIQDPARNAYFRIGWREFAVLAHWQQGHKQQGGAKAVAQAVRDHTSLDVDEDDVEEVYLFLQHNELLALNGSGDFSRWIKKRQAGRKQSLLVLVRKALFLRVSLLKPEPVLHRLAPVASLFFHTRFWLAVGGAALGGAYLVLRQWDSFLAGFGRLESVQGAVYAIIAIVISKIFHEFAHACAAHRYGLKVPDMGVAFMVFWPVLYSDTTDSWRLKARAPRLRIAAAGILVELALASFALLAWGLLPGGGLRDGVFVLASITWIMTLAINLNPLMKFDGYYLLADWLGIDNLHTRAFAMGIWRLRTGLLGMSAPCPEPDLSRRYHRFLILLCYAVWAYRIFLTLGIAFLIYSLLFKALGILLMILATTSMLLMPIGKEIKDIWHKRADITNKKRLGATVSAVIIVLLLLALPWYSRVSAPALLHASRESVIYAPTPARINTVGVAPGDTVLPGQVLFRLHAPQLEWEIKRLTARLRGLALRIARARSNSTHIQQEPILRQQFFAARAELEGLHERKDNLVVRASFHGRVAQTDPHLRPGLWIDDKEPLAVIANGSMETARAYVDETDIAYVRVGDRARFYPDAPDMAPLDMRVSEIDGLSTPVLTDAILATPLGGGVAAQEDPNSTSAGPGTAGQTSFDKNYIPDGAVFRVRLAPVTARALAATRPVLRGRVQIDGQGRSPLAGVWTTMLGVLIRESGF